MGAGLEASDHRPEAAALNLVALADRIADRVPQRPALDRPARLLPRAGRSCALAGSDIPRSGVEPASCEHGSSAKFREVPITNAVTLHDARERFIAAAGLDASGVPPKIASMLMDHATPARQPGAAQIALARYTHALPEDIEDARDKLATYPAKHREAEVGRG